MGSLYFRNSNRCHGSNYKRSGKGEPFSRKLRMICHRTKSNCYMANRITYSQPDS